MCRNTSEMVLGLRRRSKWAVLEAEAVQLTSSSLLFPVGTSLRRRQEVTIDETAGRNERAGGGISAHFINATTRPAFQHSQSTI